MFHLCLVSKQPMPNLTPALDPEFKPEGVVLAISPQMRSEADAQEAVLLRHQIQVERLLLDDAYDLPRLLDTFCGFLDRRSGNIMLNATGGTKPMAIAAQEAFRMAGKPVFYVHDKEDKIVWLDKSRDSIQIKSRLKLEPFLQAHGFSVSSKMNLANIQPLWTKASATLAEMAVKDPRSITALNAISAMAKGDARDTARLKEEAKGNFAEVVHLLYEAGIVGEYDDLKVPFTSEDARFFANGGWLELYFQSCLSRVKGLQDSALNLVVVSANGTKNEIDAAILHRNRLTLVECKTRNYVFSAEKEAADALYKLDSLTQLGGLRTSGILVSCLPLRDFIVKRANGLHIDICQEKDVLRLPEILRSKFH